jgi:hypothetical protein
VADPFDQLQRIFSTYYMITNQKLLIVCLLLFPILSFAQFPTAIGTKWEYCQFREDYFIIQDMISSWEDEVVADTVAGGQTYQVVRRTGYLYSGFGIIPTPTYDTLDGTYYYRVQGSKVWVLDSVVSGNAYESLLYEFGLGLGDTLQGRVKNVINLTPRGRIPFSYPAYYDFDIVCSQTTCDSVFQLVNQPGNSTWLPTCVVWAQSYSNCFLPGIGTVFSHPLMITLDVYGQYYLLKQLTSNGQVLYRNGLMVSAESAVTGDAVQISPNPATDQMRITSHFQIREVKVVDVMGKTLFTHFPEAFSQQEVLDLGALPRGLYWLVVQGESQTATKSVLLR